MSEGPYCQPWTPTPLTTPHTPLPAPQTPSPAPRSWPINSWKNGGLPVLATTQNWYNTTASMRLPVNPQPRLQLWPRLPPHFRWKWAPQRMTHRVSMCSASNPQPPRAFGFINVHSGVPPIGYGSAASWVERPQTRALVSVMMGRPRRIVLRVLIRALKQQV